MSEAEEPEQFPRAFGGYTLLGRLGTGGMGEVYLAARQGFAGIAKQCVVKMLRPGFGDDPEYVRRFLDEARIVVQLNHKNICPVFDVGKQNGRHFLAMEYIAGRDLRTVGARAAAAGRALSPGMALFIASEVLEALDYAHRLADVSGAILLLVHRDVSPHNVMIGFEGDVRLIDFGLAASTIKTEMTAPNVVMGKVAYMPQEQICGEMTDARADQFAAAVMAYELFAGERFYEDRSAKEVYHLAAQGGFRPKKFATLPDELRAILDKALQVDRAARFASCGEMREAIETFRFQSGLRGDGPALRALMQSVFAADALQERAMMTRFGIATSSGPSPAAAPAETAPAPDVTLTSPSASGTKAVPPTSPARSQSETKARAQEPLASPPQTSSTSNAGAVPVATVPNPVAKPAPGPGDDEARAFDARTSATTSVPSAKSEVVAHTEAVRRASGTLSDDDALAVRPTRAPLYAAAFVAVAVLVTIVAIVVHHGDTAPVAAAGDAAQLAAPVHAASASTASEATTGAGTAGAATSSAGASNDVPSGAVGLAPLTPAATTASEGAGNTSATSTGAKEVKSNGAKSGAGAKAKLADSARSSPSSKNAAASTPASTGVPSSSPSSASSSTKAKLPPKPSRDEALFGFHAMSYLDANCPHDKCAQSLLAEKKTWPGKYSNDPIALNAFKMRLGNCLDRCGE